MSGTNLLALFNGGKDVSLQASPVVPNPTDFPSDLSSYGNEFELPKGKFEFGSGSGASPLEECHKCNRSEKDMDMMDMEHASQFATGMDQGYGSLTEQQGYPLNNQLTTTVQELAAAQLNADIERDMNSLRAENEELMAKCELAFSSYNTTVTELNTAKQLEVDLGALLAAVYKERSALTDDLSWVMHKGMPKMVKRVFESDEFHREVSNLLRVMVEKGLSLGPQESLDELMSKKMAEAIEKLRKIRWGCVNEITGAPGLSVALLRYALRHRGDSSST